MNQRLTSPCQVFIDSESLPSDLSGPISVNLPEAFPHVSPDEIAHLHCFHIQEGEYKGKALVQISILRHENSIKGGIPTTTLISGGDCYLTAEGVKHLFKSEREPYFKWMIQSTDK